MVGPSFLASAAVRAVPFASFAERLPSKSWVHLRISGAVIEGAKSCFKMPSSNDIAADCNALMSCSDQLKVVVRFCQTVVLGMESVFEFLTIDFSVAPRLVDLDCSVWDLDLCWDWERDGDNADDARRHREPRECRATFSKAGGLEGPWSSSLECARLYLISVHLPSAAETHRSRIAKSFEC